MVTAPVFVLTVQSFCRLRRRSLTEQNSPASSPMPETATNASRLRKLKLPRKPNAPGSFWLQKDCALPAIPSGSTPTLMFAKDETGVTEMRAGVCALFDLFMSNVGACTVDDIAGSVLATVIGRQVDKRRVILDCGFLALSRDRGTARQAHDYGYGLVCGIDGKPLADGTIVLTGTNQEHGILTLPENSPLTQEDFPIGRRLRILPNHACPTAAPYASLVLIENGRVAEVLDHVRGWD